MKITIKTVLLGSLLLLPAIAQSNDIVGDVLAETTHKVFTETERRIIRDYYGVHYPDTHKHHKKSGPGKPRSHGPGADAGSGLPKGLARQGRLPPGLQKQLDETGRLPPGLEKKALPGDLLGQLPPAPPGYERAIVDAHVVLIHTASQILADIITDIIYPDT